MPQAAATNDTQIRRAELPLAGRQAEVRAFTRAQADDEQAPLATCELIFSGGNALVKRYDWLRDRVYNEQLVVEEGAIRMARLERGAPLLNTHSAWSLEDQLGVVDSPRIDGGVAVCGASFSRRASVQGYVQDVEDRVFRNVSVGYVRHRIEMVPPVNDGDLWLYRVIDWEPYEVSLVPIPADMDAQIRSGAASPQGKGAPNEPAAVVDTRTFLCEFFERAASPSSPAVGVSAESNPKEHQMPGNTQAAGGTTTADNPQDEAQRAAQEAATRAATERAAAEAAVATRAAGITELCARHNVSNLAADMIRTGKTVAEAGIAVLEELARRDAAGGGHRNTRVETVTDEQATRMAGMQEALEHRVLAGTKLTDNGRQFRSLSLLEMSREFLEMRGINTRSLQKLDIAQRALHFRSPGYMGTGDFSSLFANVANKRLRNSYDDNAGTYTMWARRAPNAPDFKSMSIVQLSAAPDLLKTNEHGEFKYASMSDGAETYSLLTYGIIVGLTRQAIINDDLRGFERLVGGFGGASRRLENRLVYAQLTANAALSDTVALFHATHANLGTGGGSALSFDALKAGRTAMRLQKGLQSEELNLAPAYLIVPATLEQTAYQLTSSNYVPATKAEVNEFRQGGRTAVEPVVEPVLDANSTAAWYLAASNQQVDTVEYCYLDGAEGPFIESEPGFEVDGISWKARLDFAAKAVDFRGLYKGAGS
ncbi:prohead protease/major capsid protein fusion protein [Methylibium sp.]|uniref:prohead protease/major capsid protein fusion protein n=1 Tax=Methylibium sp. TaxID=2067992 RepID=UPI003BAA7C91